MGRVAIFSDLHIHPFPAFGRPNEEGINRRLADIGSTLTEILKRSEEAKCDAVLFAGDFFHTKKLDIETLAVATRALKSSDIPIYAIPGNHDEARKMADLHSLRPFRNRIRILDNLDGRSVQIKGGFSVAGIPFLYYKDDLKKALSDVKSKPDILLMHTGWTGTLMGSDFILDCSDTLSIDDAFGHAGLVASGHFHQPQLFVEHSVAIPGSQPLCSGETVTYQTVEGKSLLVPGAPVQHGFGDEGSLRGFWIYDGKSLAFNQLEAVGFVKAKIINANDPALVGKYVTFEADSPAELRSFEAPKNVADSVVTLRKPEKAKDASRVDVSHDMAYKEVLKRYTASQEKDPDRQRTLEEVGSVLMEMSCED